MPVTIDGTNGITNGGGYTGDGVSFADATPANTLVTTTGGNVGIGTSSPSSKTEISNSAATHNVFKISQTNTSYNTDFELANSANTTSTTLVSKRTTGDLWLYQSGAHNIGFYTSAAERMRISAAGDVGIGAASVTGYRLYLVGSTSDTTTYPLVIRNSSISNLFYIRADGLITAPPTYNATITSGVRDLQIDSGGTLGYVASIRAAKTNIAALTDVSWLNQLQPRTFNFRKRDDEGNYTDEVEPELQYGLIAEEVEQVNPELVFYDQTENGLELRGVHYNKLIVPLLAEVQKLRAELTDTKARLAAVEGAIA